MLCSGRVQEQGRQHHGRRRPARLDHGAASRDEAREEDVGGEENEEGQGVEEGGYALIFFFFRREDGYIREVLCMDCAVLTLHACMLPSRQRGGKTMCYGGYGRKEMDFWILRWTGPGLRCTKGF